MFCYSFHSLLLINLRRNDTLKGDGKHQKHIIIIITIFKKKWYSERRRKDYQKKTKKIMILSFKKKWYSERRRKLFLYIRFNCILVIFLRRNDTLKGDGNTLVFFSTYLNSTFIRRSDTLKGDGNLILFFNFFASFSLNKKKWYSERRRKH